MSALENIWLRYISVHDCEGEAAKKLCKEGRDHEDHEAGAYQSNLNLRVLLRAAQG